MAWRPTGATLFVEKVAAPAVTDDQNEGYLVGDIWIDETADKSYICLDVTVGVAVWTELGGAGGGVTDHGALTGLEDDDHGQYIKDSEFTVDSEILVGTGAGTFQKESGATLRTSIGVDASGTLSALATKDPPIDADKAIYRDSTASDALVTSTWTQVKAFLKTYFDTLYNKYTHPNHSGEVTSVGDGAQTIAVAAVTLAKMANMATASIIGRNTAGVGVPEVLSKATALSLLNVEDGAEANNISDVNATDLTDGGDTTLHDHDGITENTDARHTQGTDTALGVVGTKNPPIDADKALYRDSTSSDVLVTSTWTQIKAFLKTYFDTLYQAVSTAVLLATYAAKGNILIATEAGVVTALTVGDDDDVLTADSGESSGVKWAAVSASGCSIKTGTYTGDGTTSKAVTGVGFRPKFVRIELAPASEATLNNIYEKTDQMGIYCKYHATGAHGYLDNRVVSLDADGFTVSDDGSNYEPNVSGIDYIYLALG